jgi:hypothetical protein
MHHLKYLNKTNSQANNQYNPIDTTILKPVEQEKIQTR